MVVLLLHSMTYPLVPEGGIPEACWVLARVFMRLKSIFGVKIPRDVT